MSEYDEQVAFFEWLAWEAKKRPELALVFAIPNGEKRSVITGARLKKAGVKPGVPDIFVPLANQNFHGLWIELKVKGRTVTAAQNTWLLALHAQGYATHVCQGWEAAKKILLAYLEGRKDDTPGRMPGHGG
jgi:VRR-NUC domain